MSSNPLSVQTTTDDSGTKTHHVKIQPFNTNAGGKTVYAHAHETCDAAKMTAEEFEEQTNKIFRSDCYSFSGSMDSQLSADVYDLSKGFPKMNKQTPEVQSGGACTNSMLQSLNDHPDISFGDLLCSTRAILKDKGYKQVPQLATNHQVNLRTQKFSINNPHDVDGKGRKRALIIGINYKGTDGELNGCVNDAKAWKAYLKTQGWDVDNTDVCRTLSDDPSFSTDGLAPTGANILKLMKWLVDGCKSEDSLFLSFSGHGTQVGSWDEEDGYNECLCPVDFEDEGFIADDNIFATLITPLPAHCRFVSVFDCCHSGSMCDFPHVFEASAENVERYRKGEIDSMFASPIFNFESTKKILSDAASGMWNSFKDMSQRAYRRTCWCCCC